MNVNLENNSLIINNDEIISNNFRCSICGSIPIIKLKNLSNSIKIIYTCENNHEGEKDIENYLLDLNNSINTIKCKLCQKNNASFYSLSSKQLICKECEKKKENDTIKINDIGIKSKKHNESIFGYCNDCKQKLCNYCEGHKKHNITILSSIMLQKNDINNFINLINQNKEKLKKIQNIYNRLIKIFDEMRNKLKESFDNFYKNNKNEINLCHSLINIYQKCEKEKSIGIEITKDIYNIIKFRNINFKEDISFSETENFISFLNKETSYFLIESNENNKKNNSEDEKKKSNKLLKKNKEKEEVKKKKNEEESEEEKEEENEEENAEEIEEENEEENEEEDEELNLSLEGEIDSNEKNELKSNGEMNEESNLQEEDDEIKTKKNIKTPKKKNFSPEKTKSKEKSKLKNNNNNNNKINVPKDIFNRYMKLKKSYEKLNDIKTIVGPYYQKSDNEQYYGEINEKNNKKHGRGIWKSEDQIYVGYFKNGFANGKGTLETKESKFIGIFENGNKKSGKEIFKNKCVFEGEYENNKFKQGKFIYLSRNIYEGSFNNNKRDGKGSFTLRKNGKKKEIYEGNWKENEKHGEGVIIYPNGNKFEGFWENGKLIKGKYYSKKEDKYYHFNEKDNNFSDDDNDNKIE